MQGKMLGKKHEPQCDCNVEEYVSGAFEKCNHRYGNKRQRAQEKRQVLKEMQEEYSWKLFPANLY